MREQHAPRSAKSAARIEGATIVLGAILFAYVGWSCVYVIWKKADGRGGSGVDGLCVFLSGCVFVKVLLRAGGFTESCDGTCDPRKLW